MLLAGHRAAGAGRPGQRAGVPGQRQPGPVPASCWKTAKTGSASSGAAGWWPLAPGWRRCCAATAACACASSVQGATRELRTPTLFVGNNALQLEQLGFAEAAGHRRAASWPPSCCGRSGALAMLGLLLRGAFGRLGEADQVIHIASRQLTVARPRLGALGARGASRSRPTARCAWMRAAAGPFESRREPLGLIRPAAPAPERLTAAMTLLLQVSDPHFGTERPAVVEALVRLAHAQRPDVLLLSGDITQRATRGAVRGGARLRAAAAGAGGAGDAGQPRHSAVQPAGAAAAALRALPARPSARAGAQLRDDDRAACSRVNTTRWWRHEDGAAVGRADRARGAAPGRRRGPAQWRVVVVHQPVVVTRPEDRTTACTAMPRRCSAGARRAPTWCWAATSTCLLCCRCRALGGLPRPMWAVQAGTAVSRRVRAEAGNSVNLIRIARPAAAPRRGRFPRGRRRSSAGTMSAASGPSSAWPCSRLPADDGG